VFSYLDAGVLVEHTFFAEPMILVDRHQAEVGDDRHD
jgi:hypothetical protein